MRARCCILCVGSSASQVYFDVPAILGVLVACQQVYASPAWCRAAWMALCEGRGDLHPSWRSSIVESGIKVSVVTWQTLVANQEESRKRFGGREAILSVECCNNVD